MNAMRVVLFGECMIEFRNEAPSLMRQSFSGDTLNTAVYLRRLAGAAYSVCYASAVGADDPFSAAMLASWQAEGIDTRYVSRRPGELPGIYTIQVDSKGERAFSYWRQNSAARNYFEDATTPLERAIEEVDVFYLSGISLAILPPPGRHRLMALLARLRASGALIVFDNNYRARLWSSAAEARAAYQQAYALADIALVTLSDEMEIDQHTDEAAAIAALYRYPCKELVIKRGAGSTLVRLANGARRDDTPGGAIGSDADTYLDIPVEPVDNVVDTTAAGDSFGAGYLSARLRGQSPAAAAKAGNRLAAAVIQHPGAIIALDNMPF